MHTPSVDNGCCSARGDLGHVIALRLHLKLTSDMLLLHSDCITIAASALIAATPADITSTGQVIALRLQLLPVDLPSALHISCISS